jgi:hypothetical protein
VHLRFASACLKMYGCVLRAMLFALQDSGDFFEQYPVLSLDFGVSFFIELESLLVSYRLLNDKSGAVQNVIVYPRPGFKDLAPVVHFIFLKKGSLNVSLGMKHVRLKSCSGCLLTYRLQKYQFNNAYLIAEILLS